MRVRRTFANGERINMNGYSKRKFKKVIFRLPTEKEWIRAAKDSLRKGFYGVNYPLMLLNGNKGCNFRRITKNIYTNKKTGEISIQTRYYSYK